MLNRNSMSRMKKLRLLAVAVLSAFIIPTSVYAGASDVPGKKAPDAVAPQDRLVASEVHITRANSGQMTPMGAGEWDYLGAHYTDSAENPSNYVKSGGGNFKYQISAGPAGGAWYELREYDPGSNRDDIITDADGYSYFYLYPGDTLTYYGISGAVDGDNKRAEFYVYETFSGHATAKFWD